MRLKTTIQKNMILIIAATLVIAYAMTTFVVYRQTVRVMEDEVRQEADYICTAIEISGPAYLEEMDAVRENTRVTWITEDGEVLYDSGQDEETEMENHADRPEVKEALKNGRGSNVRRSDTLNEEMFYYAVRLSDGTILRVSKTMDTAFRTALNVLPGMGVIAVVMLLLAAVLSRNQVAKMIRPINELDLNVPLENEMYEELTPLLKRIDEQNKQKDAIADMRKEFSANVSHELKTPLTSISGYAEIMKNKLSKLDEGAIEVEKEDVDLYELTREIVSRLAPQAESRNVHLEVTGENVIYHGVRQILDEMIYNICEHAVKYNKKGGSVSVWVGATLKGKKVIVSDTGIGIPKDQQERIFERFYRVDKSHSKETGGTGLGLSIVKHGAIMHNAQIHVESEEGKGTKMEITF